MKITKSKIKVCCISSIEEATFAIEAGASALGLVGEMPSGPGIISDQLIQTISQSIPPEISSFLLTSKTSSKKIIAHHKKVKTSTIQIVDELKEATYEEIRAAIPHINLVQVIHVVDETSIKAAVKLSPYVDFILLDSGNPNLKVKKLGGTRRVHDWELSKKIRAEISTPVFLAGGITVSNAKTVIEQVQPYGLDLCSGLRTNGKLDKKKVLDFFEVVNRYA